jgi:hypothetical protein
MEWVNLSAAGARSAAAAAAAAAVVVVASCPSAVIPAAGYRAAVGLADSDVTLVSVAAAPPFWWQVQLWLLRTLLQLIWSPSSVAW